MCFDVEQPDVFHAKNRTARKEHKCGECRAMIGRGEKYEHAWGVWCGKPGKHKTCMACVAMREAVERHEYAMGCDLEESSPPFGQVLAAFAHVVGTEWSDYD